MKPGRKPGSLARYRCCVCGTVEASRGGSNTFRCAPCKAAGAPLPFGRRNTGWTGGPAAGSAARAAVRDGLLPPVGEQRCADCGGQAEQYDHRDYNKPLQVDPTCRSCNLSRGPAIPLQGAVERLLARGLVPYRQRRRVAQLCALMGKPSLANGLPSRVTVSDWHRIWPELVTEQNPAPAKKPAAAPAAPAEQAA